MVIKKLSKLYPELYPTDPITQYKSPLKKLFELCIAIDKSNLDFKNRVKETIDGSITKFDFTDMSSEKLLEYMGEDTKLHIQYKNFLEFMNSPQICDIYDDHESYAFMLMKYALVMQDEGKDLFVVRIIFELHEKFIEYHQSHYNDDNIVKNACNLFNSHTEATDNLPSFTVFSLAEAAENQKVLQLLSSKSWIDPLKHLKILPSAALSMIQQDRVLKMIERYVPNIGETSKTNYAAVYGRVMAILTGEEDDININRLTTYNSKAALHCLNKFLIPLIKTKKADDKVIEITKKMLCGLSKSMPDKVIALSGSLMQIIQLNKGSDNKIECTARLDNGNNDVHEDIKWLFRLLRGNSHFTSLSFQDFFLDEMGMRIIADFLKTNNTLLSINLSNTLAITSGIGHIADALKFNKSLTTLDLNDNNIREEWVGLLADALKVNQFLTTLNLRNNNIGEAGARSLADALKVNQFLTRLNLKNNNIGGAGARFLADALKVNIALTHLDLGDNKIESNEARYIANSLEVNTKLVSIDLYGNYLSIKDIIYILILTSSHQSVRYIFCGTSSIRDLDDIILVAALLKNSTITDFGFGRQSGKFPEGAVQILAELLSTKKNLLKFMLPSCDISPQGAKYISEALTGNTTLTELNLYSNMLGPLGTSYVVDILKVNQTLTTLNLADNQIGNEGAKYISAALRVNKTLTKLDLQRNNIGSEGAKSLADALRLNNTLLRLFLNNNPNISNTDIGIIVDSTAANKMRILALWSNNFTEQHVEKIREAIENNIARIALEEKNARLISEGEVQLSMDVKEAVRDNMLKRTYSATYIADFHRGHFF